MPEMVNAMMESLLGKLRKVFRCDKPNYREPHEEDPVCCDGILENRERGPARPHILWMPEAWQETGLMSGGQTFEDAYAFTSVSTGFE